MTQQEKKRNKNATASQQTLRSSRLGVLTYPDIEFSQGQRNRNLGFMEDTSGGYLDAYWYSRYK